VTENNGIKRLRLLILLIFVVFVIDPQHQANGG